jgi:hypothetical protein
MTVYNHRAIILKPSHQSGPAVAGSRGSEEAEGAFISVTYSFSRAFVFGWLVAYLREYFVGFAIYRVKRRAEMFSFKSSRIISRIIEDFVDTINEIENDGAKVIS